jgi:hypothetical protein
LKKKRLKNGENQTTLKNPLIFLTKIK